MKQGRMHEVVPTFAQHMAYLRHIFHPLDIALCAIVLFMVFTERTDIFLHAMFLVLILGAFLWDFQQFVIHSCVWVAITTVVVAIAASQNLTDTDDVIEVGMLCLILALVYGITHRRAQTQKVLATMLASEQEHAKRLTELTVLKADFTAMVAHELGSPLLAIRSLADMLASGRLNVQAQGQVINSIHVEVGMLTALMGDVQTAAAVERDDFLVHLRPMPVRVLLADAAVYAETLPGQHPIHLSINTHQMVLTDPDRLGQVFRNLLNNAAKYSPPATPITLHAVEERGRVQIIIADAGVGIHPNDLAHIFEKFGRGRDLDGRQVAGAGLGLYLSRRIVQAHGSELAVESTLGMGSAFSFILEVVQ